MRYSLLISTLILVVIGCARKGTAYSDCVPNEGSRYVICIANINPKSRVLKIIATVNDEVVYKRDLTNGGNAVWISETVIEVEVFSGYSQEITTYHYDVVKGAVVNRNHINNQ